jgi:hypothetical protein
VSETVLDYLLMDTAFPEALQPWVVETYGKSHPEALVANRYMGAALVPLAQRCQKLKGDDAWYLTTGWSAEVVDAILGTGERRAVVLEGIIAFWQLSDEDQMRLVARKLPFGVGEVIYASKSFCDAARNEAGTQRGHDLVQRPPRKRYVRRAKTVPRGRNLLSYKLSLQKTYAGRERLLARPVESLAQYGRDGGRYLLGDLPAPFLGDGTTPESEAAWATFLGLSTGDANPTLGSLLETAKRLSASE